MSGMAQYIGKMVKIPREDNISDRAYADKVLKQFNKEFEQDTWDFWKNDLETYFSEMIEYWKHTFVNGEVYKITKMTSPEVNPIFNIVDNGKGEYSFVLSYYENNCSFNEAMRIGLNNSNM